MTDFGSFKQELRLFIDLNCKIGSDDCYTQVYTFNSLFIKWSCKRELTGLSDLCPLNSMMVIDEMEKLGYPIGPNPNITGNYYTGIELCSEDDLVIDNPSRN